MKPILAARSLSPAGALVEERAAHLARTAGAPLHVLHVPARGRAVLAIIAKARALEPSFVVMGARHAQRVQRRLGVPVLVAAGPAFEPYRSVLFASDLAQEDASAIALLRERFPQARMRALHVFQWHAIRPLRLAFVAPEVLERYRRRAQAEAAAALQRFAARHRLGASLHPGVGDVAAALRAHAGAHGADLLVLSPERSWLKTLLGASVTRRLLADPPCDVLLAPGARDALPERAGWRRGRDAIARAPS